METGEKNRMEEETERRELKCGNVGWKLDLALAGGGGG